MSGTHQAITSGTHGRQWVVHITRRRVVHIGRSRVVHTGGYAWYILTRSMTIAMLDVLGTKGSWARSDPDHVADRWRAVMQSLENSVRDAQTLQQRLAVSGDEYLTGLLEDVHFEAFSDTIIVILTSEASDFRVLVHAIGKLLVQPFIDSLFRHFFFRGVISIGEFYRADRLLIGPAIDEAAEWYDEPDWIGISTAPSATFALKSMLDQGGSLLVSEYFKPYEIPTKTGAGRDGFALIWPKHVPNVVVKENNSTIRTLLLTTFSQNPVGISAISKYTNTLAFFDRYWRPDSVADATFG